MKLAASRSGCTVEEMVIEGPSWDDVEAAIARLDGADYNDLYLHLDDDDDETYLAVAGGPDAFVVFLCVGNREFYEAFDELESEDSVSLRVGGQVGAFTRRQLIDPAATLRAARTYYDTAELDGTISWQSK